MCTRRCAGDERAVTLVEEARRRIRANARVVSGSDGAVDGARELASTVGYARMIAKRVGRRTFAWDEATRGVTRFVARVGRVEAASGRDEDGPTPRGRVATGVLSHEEAWSYHNRLIDRQHFGRRLKKYMPEPL